MCVHFTAANENQNDDDDNDQGFGGLPNLASKKFAKKKKKRARSETARGNADRLAAAVIVRDRGRVAKWVGRIGIVFNWIVFDQLIWVTIPMRRININSYWKS